MKKTVEKPGSSQLKVKKDREVSKNVLITGGSVSGMLSALEISRLGFKTTLLEMDRELQDNHVSLVVHGSIEMKESLLERINQDKNIDVISPASIIKIDGTAGNFSVKIRKDNEIFTQKYGVIIIARQNIAGTVPVFLRFQSTGIISQQELARLLGSSSVHMVDPVLKKAGTIAFVFSDSSENSRHLTISGLRHACLLKKLIDCEVYIFITHLIADSEGVEKLYREARGLGVVFIKYNESFRIISNKNGSIGIAVKDIYLNEDVELFCDLLVIGEKFVPCSQVDVLKSGYDSQGYYQDANVFLYPVSSRRKGIFFVGESRGDQDMVRTNMDILNAALNSYELLSYLRIDSGDENVKVESEKCKTCLTCIRVCPHRAIELVPFSDPSLNQEKSIAGIFPEACFDCGICSSFCPAKAIAFNANALAFDANPLAFDGYSDEQMDKEIDNLKQGMLLVFCCAESASLAAERAAELGLHYSPRVKIIRVPCTGRVDLIHIFKAFEKGVSGVLLAGCPVEACNHLEGNTRAKERVKYARGLLKGMGINEERLRMIFIGHDMAHRFVREITEMMETLDKEDKK